MTPSLQGHKKPYRVPPKEGWKENTYYVCDVAFSSSNVIHNAIFYTGFICESSGEPLGYNGFVHGSGYEDGSPTYRDAYYVIPKVELMDEDMKIVNKVVNT